MRRQIIGIVAAASLGAAGLVATAPAQAANTLNFTVSDCTAFSSTVLTGFAPGDTLNFSVPSGACDRFELDASVVAVIGDVTSTQSITSTSGARYTYTLNGAAQTVTVVTRVGFSAPQTLAFFDSAVSGRNREFAYTSGGGGGAPSGGSSRTSTMPADVIQQFGLPSAATCDASASSTLDWSGVAAGRWSTSWASWMNGGVGGPVCTRTLFYDRGSSAWSVR